MVEMDWTGETRGGGAQCSRAHPWKGDGKRGEILAGRDGTNQCDENHLEGLFMCSDVDVDSGPFLAHVSYSSCGSDGVDHARTGGCGA